ncbi:MAG: phosphatase PAP2 family protein [Patescibacteria group bacterium]
MLRNFLNGLRKNTIESFTGKNVLWHFLAIVLTYIIVTSGFDWFYFESTRNVFLQQLTLLPAIIGFFVPIAIPTIIYIFGKLRKNTRNIIASLGVAQAGLIGYLISIVYKTFTGRTQPEFLTHISTMDISRDFNFGFLQHGIFWGWPSSHTAVAFAMSFALVMLYPNNKKVKFLALLYAFYIGIGISISIHWFSDFVAGAIIGALVGIVVGKNFLEVPKQGFGKLLQKPPDLC